MGRVSMINPEEAPEEIQKALAEHLAKGRKLTNEKRTLLHNLHAFLAIEESSYALDDDLQVLIGKLDADLYEYAISAANDCVVCTTYFSKLLREQHHIDPDSFQVTHRQELLMHFAQKMGHDPKPITDEEFNELKNDFLKNGGKDGTMVDGAKAEEIMVCLVGEGP